MYVSAQQTGYTEDARLLYSLMTAKVVGSLMAQRLKSHAPSKSPSSDGLSDVDEGGPNTPFN